MNFRFFLFQEGGRLSSHTSGHFSAVIDPLVFSYTSAVIDIGFRQPVSAHVPGCTSRFFVAVEADMEATETVNSELWPFSFKKRAYHYRTVFGWSATDTVLARECFLHLEAVQ